MNTLDSIRFTTFRMIARDEIVDRNHRLGFTERLNAVETADNLPYLPGPSASTRLDSIERDMIALGYFSKDA